ncbi:MAG: pyridoxamine 5'-phosphate oxidase family protein [Terriglobales bacterium]|jgi:hypothetical protein
MGKVAASIDAHIEKLIQSQPMFFVATAPLAARGHVNVSPKGMDTFRILNPATVAYLDLTGSGIETIAHLRENGRIVIMFCAFQGPPSIVRLHGRGRVVEPADADFAGLRVHFPVFESMRAIIVVELSRVSESCGFGVPLMRHEGERSQLRAWARSKGPEGLRVYRQQKNGQSVDGLAGLDGQAQSE